MSKVKNKTSIRAVMNEFLNKEGITATEFAKRTGLSKPTMSLYLKTDTTNPRLDYIDRIAEVMGMTTLEFFKRVDKLNKAKDKA